MSQPDSNLDDFDARPVAGRANRLDDNVYGLPSVTTAADAHAATHDAVWRFEFRPVTADTVSVIEAVRAAVIDLARAMDELLPDGREKALAITQLEQAQFWADAAVRRHG
jgi:hypothetical protein